MPSWFDKVFTGGAGKAKAAPKKDDAIQLRNPILDDPEFQSEQAAPRPERAKPRRVIEPVILPDDSDAAAVVEVPIRLKARPSKDGTSCVFLVDRAFLERHSAWFMSASSAFGNSPLAESIFEVNGVESVQIVESTITVTRDPFVKETWEETAKAIGERIRAHFSSGTPVVTEQYLAGLPEESVIREKINHVIATEVNPGIAAHSGSISLENVEGNTLYIRMMGGCQGCAASAITLKQGIHHAFREAVPQIGAILDVTEHAAGANPYYKRLPAGMDGNA